MPITTNVASSNCAQARYTRYNIIWLSLSMTCCRLVVFSGYSGFLHQKNWPPRYNWNIVERDVKHHKPNPKRKVNRYLFKVSLHKLLHSWCSWYTIQNARKMWYNEDNWYYVNSPVSSLLISWHAHMNILQLNRNI